MDSLQQRVKEFSDVTNRKEAHFRLSSARLLDSVKTQSKSREKKGSTLLSKGSGVHLLRLCLHQRNQPGIEFKCVLAGDTWAGWKTSSPERDGGDGSRLSSRGVETWPQSASEFCRLPEFYSAVKGRSHRTASAFWGSSLVIIDWSHLSQNDGSPHPPSSGERRDVSLHSRSWVFWIRGVFCSDRFLYWLVLIIPSWTFPCATHSAAVTPTQAGKLFPKGDRFTLVLLPQFCCWQLWMETGIRRSQQTQATHA